MLSCSILSFCPDFTISGFDWVRFVLDFALIPLANFHQVCTLRGILKEFVQLPLTILAEVCCKVWSSSSRIRASFGQEFFLIEGCRQEKRALQEMQLPSMLIRKPVDNLEDQLRLQLLKRKSMIWSPLPLKSRNLVTSPSPLQLFCAMVQLLL